VLDVLGQMMCFSG
jgi:hypothetical protein